MVALTALELGVETGLGYLPLPPESCDESISRHAWPVPDFCLVFFLCALLQVKHGLPITIFFLKSSEAKAGFCLFVFPSRLCV